MTGTGFTYDGNGNGNHPQHHRFSTELDTTPATNAAIADSEAINRRADRG